MMLQGRVWDETAELDSDRRSCHIKVMRERCDIRSSEHNLDPQQLHSGLIAYQIALSDRPYPMLQSQGYLVVLRDHLGPSGPLASAAGAEVAAVVEKDRLAPGFANTTVDVDVVAGHFD